MKNRERTEKELEVIELLEKHFQMFWVETTGEEAVCNTEEDIVIENMYDSLIPELIDLIKND